MELLPKEPYKKVFCLVLYAVLIFIFLFMLFKYALPVLLPFIISFGIACAVRRPAEFLHEKTGAGKNFLSVLLGLALLALCGYLVGVCVWKLISELSSFAKGIVERREEILESTAGFSERLDEFLARIFPGAHAGAEELRQKLSALISDGVKNIVSAITTKIPAFVGSIFSTLPKMLFFIGATVLSCFYFCLDFDKMRDFIKNNLSRAPLAALTKFKRASFSAVGKYMRASFIIFILTAAELTVGFLFIGVKYALLLAVVTAFIDMLPVFGSGTVLIPYAVYGFLSGNFRIGVGMIILYVIVTLVRQLAEPRIMGKNLGVHPIVSLTAVYAGYSFFGVMGMIFLPITIVAARNIIFAQSAAPSR